MHNKLRLISFSLIFLAMNAPVKADSLLNFDFQPPPNQNAPAPTNNAQSPVMAPSDFQKTVNDLGKQNMDSLTQQVNQQMVKKPPSPAANMPNPSVNQAPSQISDSFSGQSEEKKSAAPTAAPSAPQPTQTAVPAAPTPNVAPAATTAVAPSDESPPTSTSTTATSISNTPAAPKEPVQSQEVYTGFNFQNTDNKNGTTVNSPTTGTGSTSGWDIKY